MKRSLFVFAFLLAGAGSGLASSNLLRNAGFETAGSTSSNAYYWETGNPDKHGARWGCASRRNWHLVNGSWGGTICGSWAGTNAGGWWQEAAAQEGATYRFVGVFWADAGGNIWTSLSSGVRIEFYNAATNLLSATSNEFHDVAEKWTGHSVEATAPSSSAWVRAVIYAAGMGFNGALQFDDLTLIEVTNALSVGPCSRRTGLVISEIMYHPKDREDGKDLEFVEIYNTLPVAQDLGGFRLDGSVDYAFSASASIPPLSYLVVAKDPSAVQSVYGIANVEGPFSGSLPNSSGTVQLWNDLGALLLEVEYQDDLPWPAAADGAGHSLVLAEPSRGEADPAAWSMSFFMGGSPGAEDVYVESPRNYVVINEVLAHTDEPEVDFIELFNTSTQNVNLTGCYLTDDPDTNKYRLPGTNIAARGFLVFTTNELGFALSAGGETAYLVNSNANRVIAAARFGATENGVPLGRSPDGAPGFSELVEPATPGATNGPHLFRDVVINEIMYHPISNDDDDEYVELFNKGSSNVSIGSWQFTDGITFTFPADAVIPATGYVVVAKDVVRLRAVYTNLTAANSFGDYSGSLKNSGEKLALAKPDDPGDPAQDLVVVDEVSYKDGGRWGPWADGDGSSLELKDPRSDNALADNWADSDEGGKSAWTELECTGVLDHGANKSPATINELHVLMLHEGECLVDNVVVSNATGNLVTNSTFESGFGGWTVEGNQIRSSRDTNGYAGAWCLHVRASGGGDTGANRIKTGLSASLGVGTTNTIKCRARWLRGAPNLLLRLRGNYLEASEPLPVPANLGTPGERNSRYAANAGPAICDVSHSPVLPAGEELTIVSARVADPDGVSQVALCYRVDPGGVMLTQTMASAGSGFYEGQLKNVPAGTLVAFHVRAVDAHAPAATNRFPADAPARECLVRFGEVPYPRELGTYRFWMTQSNLDTWAAREELSNEPLDATMAYNDERAIYNAGIRYRGSPFIRQWIGEPASSSMTAYVVDVPKDDRFLGADELNLDTMEPWRDPTRLRERAAFRIAHEIGLPFSYQRYVQIYLNGVPHGDTYTDVQQVDSEYLGAWFPEADNGHLFKLDDWFEFNSFAMDDFVSTDADLQLYLTEGGVKKKARYRWSWEKKAASGFDDNYSNLFALVDAVNLSNDQYTATVEAVADIEEWMRVFALRRSVVDWDGYGYSRGKNMYNYRPPDDAWRLLLWDLDFPFGADGWPTDSDLLWVADTMPVAKRLVDHPPFRRMFWQGLYDCALEPMASAEIEPWLDEWHTALLQNGVAVSNPAAVKTWTSARRAYILQQLNSVTGFPLAITSNGGSDFSSASNWIALAGNAPIQAKIIRINGKDYALTWSSATGWTAQVVLSPGTNNLVVQAFDSDGNLLTNLTDSIKVNFTGSTESPAGRLVINEVMYNPARADAEFVELFNGSTNCAFDLSGWYLQGLEYTFSSGTVIRAGGYLVVAENSAVYAACYTNVAALAGEYAGQLDDGGETLRLIQREGTNADVLVDEVFYSDDPPWPTNADGLGPSLQLMDPQEDNNRVGNWAVGASILFTPGVSNSVGRDLPPFPNLWINELQSTNISGPRDNFNQRDPWIELYNAEASGLDLTNYYLSDEYTNLVKWTFWTNAVMPAGSFLVVWADNQPTQTVFMTNHASFRLSVTGSVALARSNESGIVIVDYVNYANIPADRSYGSFPDGAWTGRQVLLYASPGVTNNAASLPISVYINEWMADNDAVIADPVDGNYEDWLELYNAGTNEVDLSNYGLTDSLGNPRKWVISNGVTIAAGGFLLIWADSEPQQNPNGVHASWSLSKSGEAIGLYTPDNIAVDTVTFGAQALNVGEGRWWDGQANIYTMGLATPGSPNVRSSTNAPPVLAAIGDRAIDEETPLAFTVSATDTDVPIQRLTFSLDSGPAGAVIHPDTGAFAWTPAEAEGPCATQVTVRVADNGWTNGVDSETFTITVNEVNRPPEAGAVADLHVGPGSLLTLPVPASDPDLPANALGYSLEPGCPAGAGISAAGVLTWMPPDASASSTNEIRVRVMDDGSPVLGCTGSFFIVVSGLGELFEAEMDPDLAGGGITVRWNSESGATYRVAYRGDLLNEGWTNLPGDVTATSSVALKLDATTNAEPSRFYRILQLLP